MLPFSRSIPGDPIIRDRISLILSGTSVPYPVILSLLFACLVAISPCVAAPASAIVPGRGGNSSGNLPSPKTDSPVWRIQPDWGQNKEFSLAKWLGIPNQDERKMDKLPNVQCCWYCFSLSFREPSWLDTPMPDNFATHICHVAFNIMCIKCITCIDTLDLSLWKSVVERGSLKIRNIFIRRPATKPKKPSTHWQHDSSITPATWNLLAKNTGVWTHRSLHCGASTVSSLGKTKW